jgi:hypothetical protein
MNAPTYTATDVSQMRDGAWIKIATRDELGTVSHMAMPSATVPECVKIMLQTQVALCFTECKVGTGSRAAEMTSFTVGYDGDFMEFVFLAPISDPKCPKGLAFVQPILQFSHSTKKVKLSCLLIAPTVVNLAVSNVCSPVPVNPDPQQLKLMAVAQQKKNLLISSPIFASYAPSITKDQIILHGGTKCTAKMGTASVSAEFGRHFNINTLQLAL